MDEEFEVEEAYCPSYPWSWRSTAVLAGDFLTSVLDAASTLVHSLSMQAAAAHNHQVDQQIFREEAAAAIESITTQEE